MRISRIKYIEKFFGYFYPNIGEIEKEILDKIEKRIKYRIERNYSVIGYFIDGYCSRFNFAIEIDENFHYIKGKLRKRDIIRQKEIIKELNCFFLRIKVKNYLNKKNYIENIIKKLEEMKQWKKKK